jgi:hypothetical protein
MIEERIDELREKLHLLIDKKIEYSQILKTSEELDKCITQITYERLKNTSNKSKTIK